MTIASSRIVAAKERRRALRKPCPVGDLSRRASHVLVLDIILTLANINGKRGTPRPIRLHRSLEISDNDLQVLRSNEQGVVGFDLGHAEGLEGGSRFGGVLEIRVADQNVLRIEDVELDVAFPDVGRRSCGAHYRRQRTVHRGHAGVALTPVSSVTAGGCDPASAVDHAGECVGEEGAEDEERWA